MERAQSQDRGEQSLLELRRPQPAGAPSEVDGVNPHKLKAMLRRVAQRLRTARRGDESPEDD